MNIILRASSLPSCLHCEGRGPESGKEGRYRGGRGALCERAEFLGARPNMSLSLSSLCLECKETRVHADDVEVGLALYYSIVAVDTLSLAYRALQCSSSY